MMMARASFVLMAGGFLARAVTIAMRYSCVRRQVHAENLHSTRTKKFINLLMRF